MRIVVLSGGVGGSRFVLGVRAAYPDADLTVVVNTADDITLYGLRVCPDLDTMMYALAGVTDTGRGWGRADETWRVRDELVAYGAESAWFGLGDLDLATHMFRTAGLTSGATLSTVTEQLCGRWLPQRPGHARGDGALRLLPMSDDPVETHVEITGPDGGRLAVHFQEYWVRRRAEPEALGVAFVGADRAHAAPGVVAALADADLVLVAPSNPVVSIGPILAVAELRAALVATAAPVIGFAGILGGRPLLGMADRLLPAIGVAVDAVAVGRHYASRAAGGVLDGWVVDNADATPARLAELEAAGLRAWSANLLMTSPAATAAFVTGAVDALS